MEEKKKFIINALFYATIIILFILLYKIILPILLPFIIGFAVASFINFILKKIKLKSEKTKKILSAVFTLIFYLLSGTIITSLGIKLITEITEFMKYIPTVFNNIILPMISDLMNNIENMLLPINSNLATIIDDMGNSFISNAGDFIADFSTGAIKIIANGAAGVPGIIVSIILTLISSFYFAADYEKIIEFAKRIIPAKKQSIIINGFKYTKSAITAFIKSYSILFVLTFVELSIGFLILDIPYAVLIALAIAIFDLLPVLGTGGILLPWAVILLFMKNIPLAIGILILYIIITVVRNSLESRIVGTHIGLHPLATLIVMILGLKLMGLVGMLLFPILLVAVVNMKKAGAENIK